MVKSFIEEGLPESVLPDRAQCALPDTEKSEYERRRLTLCFEVGLLVAGSGFIATSSYLPFPSSWRNSKVVSILSAPASYIKDGPVTATTTPCINPRDMFLQELAISALSLRRLL